MKHKLGKKRKSVLRLISKVKQLVDQLYSEEYAEENEEVKEFRNQVFNQLKKIQDDLYSLSFSYKLKTSIDGCINDLKVFIKQLDAIAANQEDTYLGNTSSENRASIIQQNFIIGVNNVLEMNAQQFINVNVYNNHSLSTHHEEKNILTDDEFNLLYTKIRSYYLHHATIHAPIYKLPQNINDSYVHLALVENAHQRREEQQRLLHHDDMTQPAYISNIDRLQTDEDIYRVKKPVEISRIFDNTDRVMVVGRAGIGKTTFCKYVVNYWAEKCAVRLFITWRDLQLAHATKPTLYLCPNEKDDFTGLWPCRLVLPNESTYNNLRAKEVNYTSQLPFNLICQVLQLSQQEALLKLENIKTDEYPLTLSQKQSFLDQITTGEFKAILSSFSNCWSKFKMIYWIPLRYLMQYKLGEKDYLEELAGLIEFVFRENRSINQPGYERIDKGVVLKQLRNTNYSTALLLDGYDEIESYIKGDSEQQTRANDFIKDLLAYYPHYLVTSRPHAVHPKEFREIEAENYYELMGFTNEDIAPYIHTVFRLRKQSVERAHKLIELVQNNPNIWGIAHVPINLSLLCLVWTPDLFEGQTRVTMTALYRVIVQRIFKTNIEKITKKNNYDEKKIAERSRAVSAFLGEVALRGRLANKLLFSNDELSEVLENHKEQLILDFRKMGVEEFSEEKGEINNLVENTSTYQIMQQIARFGFMSGLISGEDEEDIPLEVYQTLYYSFIHLTFQDYFITLYLKDKFINQEALLNISDKTSMPVNQFLQEYVVKQPSFENVCWFLAGELAGMSPYDQKYFDMIVGDQNYSLKSPLYDNPPALFLAGRCLEEMNTQSIEQFEDVLIQYRHLAERIIYFEQEISELVYCRRMFIYNLQLSPQLQKNLEIVQRLKELMTLPNHPLWVFIALQKLDKDDFVSNLVAQIQDESRGAKRQMYLMQSLQEHVKVFQDKAKYAVECFIKCLQSIQLEVREAAWQYLMHWEKSYRSLIIDSLKTQLDSKQVVKSLKYFAIEKLIFLRENLEIIVVYLQGELLKRDLEIQEKEIIKKYFILLETTKCKKHVLSIYKIFLNHPDPVLREWSIERQIANQSSSKEMLDFLIKNMASENSADSKQAKAALILNLQSTNKEQVYQYLVDKLKNKKSQYRYEIIKFLVDRGYFSTSNIDCLLEEYYLSKDRYINKLTDLAKDHPEYRSHLLDGLNRKLKHGDRRIKYFFATFLFHMGCVSLEMVNLFMKEFYKYNDSTSKKYLYQIAVKYPEYKKLIGSIVKLNANDEIKDNKNTVSVVEQAREQIDKEMSKFARNPDHPVKRDVLKKVKEFSRGDNFYIEVFLVYFESDNPFFRQIAAECLTELTKSSIPFSCIEALLENLDDEKQALKAGKLMSDLIKSNRIRRNRILSQDITIYNMVEINPSYDPFLRIDAVCSNLLIQTSVRKRCAAIYVLLALEKSAVPTDIIKDFVLVLFNEISWERIDSQLHSFLRDVIYRAGQTTKFEFTTQLTQQGVELEHSVNVEHNFFPSLHKYYLSKFTIIYIDCLNNEDVNLAIFAACMLIEIKHINAISQVINTLFLVYQKSVEWQRSIELILTEYIQFSTSLVQIYCEWLVKTQSYQLQCFIFDRLLFFLEETQVSRFFVDQITEAVQASGINQSQQFESRFFNILVKYGRISNQSEIIKKTYTQLNFLKPNIRLHAVKQLIQCGEHPNDPAISGVLIQLLLCLDYKIRNEAFALLLKYNLLFDKNLLNKDLARGAMDANLGIQCTALLGILFILKSAKASSIVDEVITDKIKKILFENKEKFEKNIHIYLLCSHILFYLSYYDKVKLLKRHLKLLNEDNIKIKLAVIISLKIVDIKWFDESKFLLEIKSNIIESLLKLLIQKPLEIEQDIYELLHGWNYHLSNPVILVYLDFIQNDNYQIANRGFERLKEIVKNLDINNTDKEVILDSVLRQFCLRLDNKNDEIRKHVYRKLHEWNLHDSKLALQTLFKILHYSSFHFHDDDKDIFEDALNELNNQSAGIFFNNSQELQAVVKDELYIYDFKAERYLPDAMETKPAKLLGTSLARKRFLDLIDKLDILSPNILKEVLVELFVCDSIYRVGFQYKFYIIVLNELWCCDFIKIINKFIALIENHKTQSHHIHAMRVMLNDLDIEVFDTNKVHFEVKTKLIISLMNLLISEDERLSVAVLTLLVKLDIKNYSSVGNQDLILEQILPICLEILSKVKFRSIRIFIYHLLREWRLLSSRLVVQTLIDLLSSEFVIIFVEAASALFYLETQTPAQIDYAFKDLLESKLRSNLHDSRLGVIEVAALLLLNLGYWSHDEAQKFFINLMTHQDAKTRQFALSGFIYTAEDIISSTALLWANHNDSHKLDESKHAALDFCHYHELFKNFLFYMRDGINLSGILKLVKLIEPNELEFMNNNVTNNLEANMKSLWLKMRKIIEKFKQMDKNIVLIQAKLCNVVFQKLKTMMSLDPQACRDAALYLVRFNQVTSEIAAKLLTGKFRLSQIFDFYRVDNLFIYEITNLEDQIASNGVIICSELGNWKIYIDKDLPKHAPYLAALKSGLIDSADTKNLTTELPALSSSIKIASNQQEKEDTADAIQLSIMLNRLSDLENTEAKRSLSSEEMKERTYIHEKFKEIASKTMSCTTVTDLQAEQPENYTKLNDPEDAEIILLNTQLVNQDENLSSKIYEIREKAEAYGFSILNNFEQYILKWISIYQEIVDANIGGKFSLDLSQFYIDDNDLEFILFVLLENFAFSTIVLHTHQLSHLALDIIANFVKSNEKIRNIDFGSTKSNSINYHLALECSKLFYSNVIFIKFKKRLLDLIEHEKAVYKIVISCFEKADACVQFLIEQLNKHPYFQVDCIVIPKESLLEVTCQKLKRLKNSRISLQIENYYHFPGKKVKYNDFFSDSEVPLNSCCFILKKSVTKQARAVMAKRKSSLPVIKPTVSNNSILAISKKDIVKNEKQGMKKYRENHVACKDSSNQYANSDLNCMIIPVNYIEPTVENVCRMPSLLNPSNSFSFRKEALSKLLEADPASNQSLLLLHWRELITKIKDCLYENNTSINLIACQLLNKLGKAFADWGRFIDEWDFRLEYSIKYLSYLSEDNSLLFIEDLSTLILSNIQSNHLLLKKNVLLKKLKFIIINENSGKLYEAIKGLLFKWAKLDQSILLSIYIEDLLLYPYKLQKALLDDLGFLLPDFTNNLFLRDKIVKKLLALLSNADKDVRSVAAQLLNKWDLLIKPDSIKVLISNLSYWFEDVVLESMQILAPLVLNAVQLKLCLWGQEDIFLKKLKAIFAVAELPALYNTVKDLLLSWVKLDSTLFTTIYVDDILSYAEQSQKDALDAISSLLPSPSPEPILRAKVTEKLLALFCKGSKGVRVAASGLLGKWSDALAFPDSVQVLIDNLDHLFKDVALESVQILTPMILNAVQANTGLWGRENILLEKLKAIFAAGKRESFFTVTHSAEELYDAVKDLLLAWVKLDSTLFTKIYVDDILSYARLSQKYALDVISCYLNEIDKNPYWIAKATNNLLMLLNDRNGSIGNLSSNILMNTPNILPILLKNLESSDIALVEKSKKIISEIQSSQNSKVAPILLKNQRNDNYALFEENLELISRVKSKAIEEKKVLIGSSTALLTSNLLDFSLISREMSPARSHFISISPFSSIYLQSDFDDDFQDLRSLLILDYDYSNYIVFGRMLEDAWVSFNKPDKLTEYSTKTKYYHSQTKFAQNKNLFFYKKTKAHKPEELEKTQLTRPRFKKNHR